MKKFQFYSTRTQCKDKEWNYAFQMISRLLRTACKYVRTSMHTPNLFIDVRVDVYIDLCVRACVRTYLGIVTRLAWHLE